ncbi:MAG: reverse transcriptase N-terminal domain-containing protein, partial [bacterium]
MLKDTEQTIRHEVGQPTNPFLSLKLLWESIDWKKAEHHVKRLQERIYRAAKRQQWAKVRNLQKLLARSYDNKIVAI